MLKSILLSFTCICLVSQTKLKVSYLSFMNLPFCSPGTISLASRSPSPLLDSLMLTGSVSLPTKHISPSVSLGLIVGQAPALVFSEGFFLRTFL